MRFADLQPGHVVEAGPYGLSESELVGFATGYDPQWFHTDTKAAVQGPFSGPTASGWHTCCIATRRVADAALHGSESHASPGIADVKWPNPVRPGDALSLRATVIESHRSCSKPGLGILRGRWRLFTAASVEVPDLEGTSLCELAKGASE